MREHLNAFQTLMRSNTLDVEAVSETLDAMPLNSGAEIAVVVEQARRSIIAVRAGNRRYRPLLRHAIGRLIELLKMRETSVAIRRERSVS